MSVPVMNLVSRDLPLGYPPDFYPLFNLIGLYDAIIFGGILRDAYSGEKRYKDIDVIALPESKKKLMRELALLGWGEDEAISSSSSEEGRRVFTNILNSSFTAIDFTSYSDVNTDSIEAWRAAWAHTSNVDIRCNAIAWTPTSGVMALPGALEDCKGRNIHVLTRHDKTVNRIGELERRGWKNSSPDHFSRKGYPF